MKKSFIILLALFIPQGGRGSEQYTQTKASVVGTNYAFVDLGSDFSGAVTDDGRVFMWGYKNYFTP